MPSQDRVPVVVAVPAESFLGMILLIGLTSAPSRMTSTTGTL